jgi:hypothetical protein
MNCDECKEQVLELIEREAIDPAGVRDLLARCPDCQSLFDEMKAALRTAAMLPLEEPSRSIDAAIVRAATARSPRRGRSRWKRLQTPPWAMAAIALFAVGIGVWTMPRGGDSGGSDGFASKHEANAELVARDELGDGSSRKPAIAPLEPTIVQAPRGAQVDRRAAETGKASSRSARAKQVAAARVAPAVARQASSARKASREEAATAAGVSTELEDRASSDAEMATPRLAKKERKDDSISACRRRVAEHERGEHADADAAIDAEQALALGSCYQKLGKKRKARRWLTRAAADPVTRARAEQALGGLDAE